MIFIPLHQISPAFIDKSIYFIITFLSSQFLSYINPFEGTRRGKHKITVLTLETKRCHWRSGFSNTLSQFKLEANWIKSLIRAQTADMPKIFHGNSGRNTLGRFFPVIQPSGDICWDHKVKEIALFLIEWYKLVSGTAQIRVKNRLYQYQSISANGRKKTISRRSRKA